MAEYDARVLRGNLGPGVLRYRDWQGEQGTLPTLGEAAGKLAEYEAHGPTEAAFGWDWLGKIETGLPFAAPEVIAS